MAKTKTSAPKTLSIKLESLNMERVERGYLTGDLCISGISFHVEAVEVRKPSDDPDETTEAVNGAFQNRIDDVGMFDEGDRYQVVRFKRKFYFVVIFPFQD